MIFFAISILAIASCNSDFRRAKPNVILIMADDMGYECLSAYGSLSYKTPNLDALALEGILFSRCISQPLCTPSRVKIMTGLYNYRNYDYFGNLHTEAYTFGNLMRDAGYSTCISGKWQLNGIYHKDEIPDWDDHTKPHRFGFDEYCLWQLTKLRKDGERYANPLIEQNGKILEQDENSYGPDIFSEYILSFIKRNRDHPFFIYYPMVLVHDPFVPTPDSDAWNSEEWRYKNDTSYFSDMVAYTDKIIGRIADKLAELNLTDNTILIFTGDNGTHTSIHSRTKDGAIQGAKGNTIDAGIHVPLIISWPQSIRKGLIYEDLIEFSDFFPTLADFVGREVISDGTSFYPLLIGEKPNPRNKVFVHYDPRWGDRVNRYRNQFAMTTDYKLYQDGKFYNISSDPEEKYPLDTGNLDENEIKIKADLEKELKKHPKWNGK
jgi:arylsulfatase A